MLEAPSLTVGFPISCAIICAFKMFESQPIHFRPLDNRADLFAD